ncbi:FG-GAP repeat domain-containing protein [Terriglobus albidus]|uniref:FG-GAP repeat domain-containing protein n=1 Tax=Terriglobus albidus TaxID=1592106 RepID=UPI0021DF479A|nr:VCBS repeat-containing protein [Terriglobus albidus]
MSAVSLSAQTNFSGKTYTNLAPTSHLAIGDINGDNYPDILIYSPIIDQTGSTLSHAYVLYNDGQGNFGSPTALPGTALFNTARIVDMNGDSYPDVVGCYNTVSGNTNQLNVVVEINNGGGNFSELPPVSAPGICRDMAVGDVYRDGHLAVITVGYAEPAAQQQVTPVFDVFSNDGSGHLTLAQSSTPSLDSPNGGNYTNCAPTTVTAGDFQKNGNFDLILANRCYPTNPTVSGVFSTFFYVSQGSSGYTSFSPLRNTESEDIVTNLKTLDLTHSGSLDFLGAANRTGQGHIEWGYDVNNGFEYQVGWPDYGSSIPYVGGAAAADFDGDGNNDLVRSGSSAPRTFSQVTLSVLPGQGGTTWGSAVSTTVGTASSYATDVMVADFNRDGKPDYATLLPDTGTQTTTLYVATNIFGSAVCTAPATPNTSTICTPTKLQQFAAGTTSVSVTAASNITSFAHNRLYLDDSTVYDTDSQSVSTSISVTDGNHHLVLVSWNSSGTSFTSSTDFTVGQPGGCLKDSPGASLCSPTQLGTYSGQITVNAGDRAPSGLAVTAIRVYIDNLAVYTSYNPGVTSTYQFSHNLNVATGDHVMVIVGYHSDGSADSVSAYFTVTNNGCSAQANQNNLVICAPQPSQQVGSPVTVLASASSTSPYIAAMRIYVDNNALATVYNNSPNDPVFTIQQPVTIPSGTHHVVVVGYPSSGGYVSSSEQIVIQ